MAFASTTLSIKPQIAERHHPETLFARELKASTKITAAHIGAENHRRCASTAWKKMPALRPLCRLCRRLRLWCQVTGVPAAAVVAVVPAAAPVSAAAHSCPQSARSTSHQDLLLHLIIIKQHHQDLLLHLISIKITLDGPS